MSKKNLNKTNFSNLRKAAEGKLNKDNSNLKKGNHLELELHKVELEMQNDELITTQKKLLKSINDYTVLFESAPIGYFILDLNGVILKVNETGCKQLAVSQSKLLNKYFSTFIKNKSCQDRFYINKNLAIETGKKQQIECKFIRQAGTTFYGLVESIMVKDENKKFKFLLSTIVDITIQKEQEIMLENALKKEKTLNELKSQFIAIASHEFRTPLATILTSSELIEKYNKKEDEEKKHKHFKKITSSVNRIKEILIDFLSADQIAKGEKKNKPKIFNLVDFMENIIDETKIFNGIHSVKYIHNGDNQNVFLDENLLKTCITNLIINAYKYSPNGGMIKIKTTQNTSGNITIEITDKGIGIPKTDETHIFEKFFRAENAQNIQGTGLGLNITKSLINLMDGKVSFKSRESYGTTFTIKFTA